MVLISLVGISKITIPFCIPYHSKLGSNLGHFHELRKVHSQYQFLDINSTKYPTSMSNSNVTFENEYKQTIEHIYSCMNDHPMIDIIQHLSRKGAIQRYEQETSFTSTNKAASFSTSFGTIGALGHVVPKHSISYYSEHITDAIRTQYGALSPPRVIIQQDWTPESP